MPKRRASGLSGGESSNHEKLSGDLDAQPQTKGVAPLAQRRVRGGGYSGHGRRESVPYFQQGYCGGRYVGAGREYSQEHGASQPHAGATLQHYDGSPTEYVNQGIEHQRLGSPNVTGDASSSGGPSRPPHFGLQQTAQAPYSHVQTLAEVSSQPDQQLVYVTGSYLEGSSLPQSPQTGCSSKFLRSPLQPDMGKTGVRCLVEDFFTELPDKDPQNNVLLTPEVSQGVNPTVMSQCVSLYRNASPTLAQTQSFSEGFAAYYVRKSLSTAGSQPLTSKDFLMSPINETDGAGPPRKERQFHFVIQGTMKSVVKYFLETYGFVIRHTTWPCLQVMNLRRPKYLPMEVCKILEGLGYSKKLNENQLTAMLKVTSQRPCDQERHISQGVQRSADDHFRYVKEFLRNIPKDLGSQNYGIFDRPRISINLKKIDNLPRGPCGMVAMAEQRQAAFHDSARRFPPQMIRRPEHLIRRYRKELGKKKKLGSEEASIMPLTWHVSKSTGKN
ncbi:hypothetical protein GIB67_012733 [Kingdonia uniflora]|uniref:PAZ domain-containing protein n=1 Tax=Kingdonia uniflora TaxID=39325 RepID=A0A7J7NF69_9MAGN|nr:hypothetical protein GIB67_012733 [Kingdonia uniflora]